MAKVLLVGSRADMTQYVAARLAADGWEVVPAVGPEEGLRAIDRVDDVDAMIVGGPAAFEAIDRLSERLRSRHPYAPIIVPQSPDTLGQQLMEALGGEAN